MEITLDHNGQTYKADLSKPLSIAIPLRPNEENPNCFYAPPCTASPVTTDTFTGSVAEGGLLNFFNVKVNPHGNGTHTESVGHLLASRKSVGSSFSKYHFIAKVESFYPLRKENGDRVITEDMIRSISRQDADCLVIRTLPNDRDKLTRLYSGTNPPYMMPEAAALVREMGFSHLLIDLPSLDREEDEGKLAAHKSFWKNLDNKNNMTISELIYIQDDIKDGLYLLNLQIPRLEMDAAPSQPVLYELQKTK